MRLRAHEIGEVEFRAEHVAQGREHGLVECGRRTRVGLTGVVHGDVGREVGEDRLDVSRLEVLPEGRSSHPQRA